MSADTSPSRSEKLRPIPRFYILRPARWFGNVLWKLFDVIIIDGIGVNLPGALTRVAGDFVALLQTGRVRNYVLSMGLGAFLLLYLFLR